MREPGVDVEVNEGNEDSYWTDILDAGTLCCYRSGAMPIESHISQRLLTDSTTNATKWRHEDFDALYQQAQSTSDETERAALYGRMQRRLHTEGGFLVWGFADWILGTAPGVRGVEQGTRQHPGLGALRQGLAGVSCAPTSPGGCSSAPCRSRRSSCWSSRSPRRCRATPPSPSPATSPTRRASRIREAMRLDRPAHERLADWSAGCSRRLRHLPDLRPAGRRHPRRRLGPTLLLAASPWSCSALAVGLGVLAARHEGRARPTG